MQGSCDNLFAYNRATHGGDGFFLSAAAESLESPSSRNVVAFNDFSYSPHNAIEATFSTDNVFYGNLCRGSGSGVWAGFSSRSSFIRNEIDGCLADGIAIEHGAGNLIDGNPSPTGDPSSPRGGRSRDARQDRACGLDQDPRGRTQEAETENHSFTGKSTSGVGSSGRASAGAPESRAGSPGQAVRA